jgi:hypothetical protein
MRTLPRFLVLLITAALLAPSAAFAAHRTTPTRSGKATTGAVHRALQGPTVDPYGPTLATSFRIQPPKRGLVMVYQNGKLRGMYSQTSWLPAADDGVYGVVAFRGQKVLFNANVVARPGVTELVWGSADVPTITYTPAMRPLTSGPALPPGVNVHHHITHDGSTGMAYVPGMGLVTQPTPRVVLAPQARATAGARRGAVAQARSLMSHSTHRGLLRDLETGALDTQRLATLKGALANTDGQLTAAQVEAVVARFKSADGQVVARQTLEARRL